MREFGVQKTKKSLNPEMGTSKRLQVSIWYVTKRTFVEFFQENSFFHGAALAYYALFSLVPMIYLAVMVFGALIGKTHMLEIINKVLAENVGLKDASGLMTFLDQINIHKGSFAMELVGIIALIFSSSALLSNLRKSINEFYDVRVRLGKNRNFILYTIGTKIISMLFLPIFGVVLLFLYFSQTFLLTLSENLLGNLGDFGSFFLKLLVSLFAILSNTVLFTLVFKYINDGLVKTKMAIAGAFLTALLLFLGQLLIDFYLNNYFFGSKAGVAGTLLVLLTFIYYTSQIIFVGAKFIKVLSIYRGHTIHFYPRRSRFFSKKKLKR